MMNLRKKFTLVAGLLAVTTVGTGVLIACSSDTSVSADAGPDGGSDAPRSETSDNDTGIPDAGKDVVNVEAGTLAEFIAANATATCTRYKECCGAGSDAGTFDTAKCLADFDKQGWDQSIADLTTAGVATGGKVTYDPVIGGQCLTTIRNMDCTNTTAAEYKTAWVKCYAAAVGTIATGGACKSNVECAVTGSCDPDAGTCTPLKAANDVCNPFTGDCSYRHAGTSVQCVDDGTGTFKCLPPLANGKTCNFDWDCASGACSVRALSPDGGNIVATCESTTDFLFGICDTYTK